MTTMLRTDTELLAQAVEASVHAIFCQSADGTVLTWNTGATRLYGVGADRMTGGRIDALIPEAGRDQHATAQRTALTGGQADDFDTWHQRADGTTFAANVSVSPLRDAAGAIIGTATSVKDVSARVALAAELAEVRSRLEAQNVTLARSNRDLEQFAYVASHDLSEPLRVMTGYVTQLERRYAEVLDERALRYMHHITEASIRMRALVDDLLEYSRHLRIEGVPQRVDLQSLAERVCAANGAPDAVLAVDGPLPAVLGDERQLRSLLANLVANAVKFVAPDQSPQVRISATEDDRVTLIVDDNGIGIAPEYRERVFRMFQRLHVREAYSGTGIGLAIAQQVAERSGGRIWCEDSPLGGTRFCVTLPAAPDA